MLNSPFHIPLSYPNRLLGYYLGKIGQQQRLLRQVQNCLPENLAAHARHCLISQDTLLVYTDSAAWASQLRFYNQALLAAVAPLLDHPVQKLQIKVLTETTGASLGESPRKANVPSAAILEVMRQQSVTVSDQTLQASLQRLNTTLRKLTDDKP